jgi:hypothetical protein
MTWPTPGGQQDLRHRDAGRAEADDQHPEVLKALAGELRGVDQRRERDDRGSVLVAMEHGDVQIGPQALFDLEAARGR